MLEAQGIFSGEDRGKFATWELWAKSGRGKRMEGEACGPQLVCARQDRRGWAVPGSPPRAPAWPAGGSVTVTYNALPQAGKSEILKVYVTPFLRTDHLIASPVCTQCRYPARANRFDRRRPPLRCARAPVYCPEQRARAIF